MSANIYTTSVCQTGCTLNGDTCTQNSDCCSGDCSGSFVCQGAQGPPWDAWFSLPNRSPIGTAEDLCHAIGSAAVMVSQIHPQDGSTASPREYQYTCPVGTGSGSCLPIGSSPAPKEPGCETSECFCIDDGDGFAVFLDHSGPPATSFMVDGCYTAYSSSLAATSNYLISVAPDAPLVTFQDLANALGLTSTGLPSQRGVMTRLNCSARVFFTATAGTSTAATANLVPGEAYRIRHPTALSYTNPISSSPCSCTETEYYDLSGPGNGSFYAWWIDSGKDGVYTATPGEYFNGSEAGVVGTAGDFATDLVASINAAPAIVGVSCTGAIVSLSPARISLTCTPCSFDLYGAPDQGSATAPPPYTGQCPLVSSSCVVNPTITRVFPSEDAGDVADTLVVGYAPGSDITLSWGSSCLATDGDYAVYEGAIGSWYSHVSRLCTTGGATTVTLTPLPDAAYYLLVPRNASREGSYGRDSSGTPRPQGGNACAVQQMAPACP